MILNRFNITEIIDLIKSQRRQKRIFVRELRKNSKLTSKEADWVAEALLNDATRNKDG